VLKRIHQISPRIFLFVAIVVLVVLWSAPLSDRVDIGRWDDAIVQGFYDSEVGAGTTFRWSHPQASITLMGVGAGDYLLDIQATAPAGSMATITATGNPSQTIQLRDGFLRYRLPAPIQVAWQLATATTDYHHECGTSHHASPTCHWDSGR
jgi:hypothetical protein